MQKVLKRLNEKSDIILMTLLGIFIRAKDLLRDELWYDEAFTGVLMKVHLRDFFNIVWNEPHPPLFYFVTRIFTSIFGVSDLTLRFLPLIFGVGTIIVLYYLIDELFDKKVAAFASAFAAVSPMLVDYSFEARSYSMYAFLFVISYLLLIKKQKTFFIISSLLFLLTHYLAIIYFGILLLIGVYYFKKELRSSWIFIPGIITSGILYYFAKSTGVKSLNTEWIKEAGFMRIFQSFISYFVGVKSKLPGQDVLNSVNFFGINEVFIGYTLILIFLLLIGIYIHKNLKNINELIGLTQLLLFITIPQITLILLSQFTKYDIYVERYLIPSAVIFIAIFAILLIKSLYFEIAAFGLLIYLAVIINITPHSYFTGMKALANAYVSTPYHVVVTSPIDYLSARYYLGENFKNRLKLYNPANPAETFFQWPFVDESSRNIVFEQASFIITEESKLIPQLTKIADYGAYRVFVLRVAPEEIFITE